MDALESCPKHNMIAYLEKTDGSAEFHEIMNFLSRSSIYYALTVSPVVSTTFVEQFWMSAKSKTINNVRYITAIVTGKPATISEASIKSDLLFNDADGIDTLNNQAIFDTIQLMGWNVTPLFNFMLVQPTEDEGEASERPSESQPIPSPSYPSEDQPESQPDPSPRPSHSILIPDSNPEGSGGNHGAFDNKDQAFDDLDDFDVMDYMETEDAHNEKGVSTGDQVSTVKPYESTDKPKVSTDKIDEGTVELKNENSDENATPTVFGDNETIAEFLVSMSQNKAKPKGVEIKDAEDSDRLRPTSTRSLLTLKPLPKIDPKDKGKKVLEEEAESDAESEGVNEAERKFAQLSNDEEIVRKVQEEWETEEEKKKLAEEEATKVALIRDYDDIHARIEADSILAARLQEEEREKFTIKERAKLLHDTIVAQISCTTKSS
ncbi:hypothetical protein Tco_0559108 [Tanacetum coccineum]